MSDNTSADRRKSEHLASLLEKAKDHVMTPAEIEAQRKSWVCGEMLLRYPTMTYDEAAARYDAAVAPTPSSNLEGLSEATARRFLKLLDVYAPDVFTLEMAATVAGAAHHADDVMKAAVEEYLLTHAAEGDDQRLGRHSAIRGLMVRLNRYPEFCAALATAAEGKP